MLVNSFKNMSYEQIASAAAITQLDAATLSATLKTAGFDQAARNEIATLWIDEQAKRGNATATGVMGAAEEGATGATWSLTAAMEGLGTVMRAHPILSFLSIAAIVVPLVVKAFDALTTSTEEQAEALAEAKQKYEDVTSELESLRSELDQVQAKMKELESGDIDLGASDDYQELKLLNDELEREIRLKEREAKIAAKDNEETAVENANTRNNKLLVGAENGNARFEQFDDVEYLDKIIEQLYYAEDRVNQAKDAYEQALLNGEQWEINVAKDALDNAQNAYDDLISKGAEAARNNQDLAASISGVTAEGRALKPELEASVDRWLDWLDYADGVDLTLTKVEDASVELKTFESIISSLDAGMEAITSAQEDMADTGYLSADSVKALKEAGLNEYLVACQGGYKLATGALNDYLEAQKAEHRNALNTAKEAAEQVIANETGKTKAYNRTTKAIINQLQVLQSEKLIKMNQLEAQFLTENGLTKGEGSRVLNDDYIDQYTSQTKRDYTTLRTAFLSDQKVLQDLVTASNQWDISEMAINTVKRDYSKTDTADPNKSEFEELYDQWKHDLEMEKITLQQFNDWLDGENGYKKYFADQTKYADEWRKYEKEVFDNSMQLHEQEATNLDHTIEMLKLQGKSEQDILEAYRKKQILLETARDLVYDFLEAQGLSEKQIKSNSTFQELNKALLENPNEAKDFSKERVDQNVADFEHVIDMLERTEGREGELIAKYREEQAYLVAVREEYRKTLVAADKTADEIAKDDWFQELTKQILDVNDAVSDTLQDLFDTASDHVNDLLDLTEDLIRQESEDMIDALEDQKDSFSEIISAKKEILKLTQREQEYNDKVAETTKDISKLQARIDALAMDDTRQAAMERAKLEEELAELQKELSDTQTDHYITVTEEALDKEEEDYHDLMDTKIQEIEDFLDDNEKVTKAALARLDNMNESLFDDLLGYAKHYTDTTGEELTAMWNTALQAAQKYGSYTNSMKVFSDSEASTDAQSIMKQMFANQNAWASTSDSDARARYDQANLQLGQQLANELGVNVWRENGTWYIGDGDLLFSDFVSGNSTAKALVKQMQDNGEAWGKATSDAERKVFEDANEQIGNQLQQMLGVPVWRENGRWYIGDGEELYKVYGFHTGGAVGHTGSVSPKADELFALLQDDEVVMSRRMVNNTLDFLTGLPKVMASAFQAPLSWAAQAVGGAREYVLNISAPLTMDGVLPKDEILSVIKQHPRKVAEVVSEQLRKL